jgi:O-antigen/teichoic acid export membrane protein
MRRILSDTVTRLFRDPLYKNSAFIMLTSATGAAVGFAFWVIAARIHSVSDLGIATAMISSSSLLIFLSRVGLEHSMLRYFPERDRSRLFFSTLCVTTALAVIAAILMILLVDVVAPRLILVRQYFFLYITFIVAQSVISVTGTVFIAMRKAEYYFLQSLFVDTKILFLFPLVGIAAIGVFSSFGLSFVLALAFSIPLLFRLGLRLHGFDRDFLRDSFGFSSANYVVEILITTPNLLIPIMVLNVLGSQASAHYYIAYALVSILMVIPSSLSTSLFVEGSHGESLRKGTSKSLSTMILLLIPAVFCLYVFGGLLLEIIGKSFSDGLELLRVLVLSVFFVGVFSVYVSVKRVQRDVRGLLWVCGLVFLLLVGLSYYFMKEFGIVGIGYAWIVAYGTASFIVVLLLRKEKWGGTRVQTSIRNAKVGSHDLKDGGVRDLKEPVISKDT